MRLCNAFAMPDTADIIGSAEACRILYVNNSTLTRWVKSGRVPVAGKLPSKNGALFFRRTDIEALAAELEGAA